MLLRRLIDAALVFVLILIGLDVLLRGLEIGVHSGVLALASQVAGVLVEPFARMARTQDYLLTALIAALGYCVLGALVAAAAELGFIFLASIAASLFAPGKPAFSLGALMASDGDHGDDRMVSDEISRLRLRDLPEYLLQNTGNLIVWADRTLGGRLLMLLVFTPIVWLFALAGFNARFPSITLAKGTAGEFLSRSRLPLIWPLILTSLVLLEFWNWVPVAAGLYLLSATVLAIWLSLSAILPFRTNEYNFFEALATALFLVACAAVVRFFLVSFVSVDDLVDRTLYSPVVSKYYSTATFLILLGAASFIFFRLAVGRDRSVATGKDLRAIIGIRDPLVANALPLLFALVGAKTLSAGAQNDILIRAAIGMLLVVLSAILSHVGSQREQATEQRARVNLIVPGADRIRGQDSRAAIALSDRIAFGCYLASWHVILWSILIYIYQLGHP